MHYILFHAVKKSYINFLKKKKKLLIQWKQFFKICIHFYFLHIFPIFDDKIIRSPWFFNQCKIQLAAIIIYYIHNTLLCFHFIFYAEHKLFEGGPIYVILYNIGAFTRFRVCLFTFYHRNILSTTYTPKLHLGNLSWST